jgi:hypothetical protein
MATSIKTLVLAHGDVDNVRADGKGKSNSINNRSFATWTPNADKPFTACVEVVRRGAKMTRIRRSLKANGDTILVKSDTLSNITKGKRPEAVTV